MTNQDIIQMIGGSILGTTTNNLSVPHALEITKFKRQINELYQKWADTNDALCGDVGISDALAFDKRRAELTSKVQNKTGLSNEEVKELDSMNSQMARLDELRAKLRSDKVSVLGVPFMNYEEWAQFKAANRHLMVGNVELYELYEIELEGVLWEQEHVSTNRKTKK